LASGPVSLGQATGGQLVLSAEISCEVKIDGVHRGNISAGRSGASGAVTDGGKLTLNIPAGTHEISAFREGKLVFHRPFRMGEGDRIPITIVLIAEAQEKDQPSGKTKPAGPESFVKLDADASGAYGWMIRVRAISPVPHYDIKIQAVLLGISSGTVRSVEKSLIVDLQPGNVPNNYIARPEGMGKEGALCYTARASGQTKAMRLTMLFKTQPTQDGVLLIPTREPTLEPASNAPCGDARVVKLYQEQQEAATKEAGLVKGVNRTANSKPPVDTAGTYNDPTTGLMWTAKDNGDEVNYGTARGYCTQLRLAGFQDWRLPTIGELQSVYDANATPETVLNRGRQQSVFIRSGIGLGGPRAWSGTPAKPFSGYQTMMTFTFSGPQVNANRESWSIVVAKAFRALCVRSY
jgi:hypothetical protein